MYVKKGERLNRCTQSNICVFDKLKKENQNCILRFWFIWKWKTKSTWLTAIFIIDKKWVFNTCVFNALTRFFIFMKNGKRNTVRSVSWRNLKTNFLKRSRLTPWLFWREWSTHYSRPSSCLSSLLRFDAVQWSRGY